MDFKTNSIWSPRNDSWKGKRRKTPTKRNETSHNFLAVIGLRCETWIFYILLFLFHDTVQVWKTPVSLFNFTKYIIYVKNVEKSTEVLYCFVWSRTKKTFANNCVDASNKILLFHHLNEVDYVIYVSFGNFPFTDSLVKAVLSEIFSFVNILFKTISLPLHCSR